MGTAKALLIVDSFRSAKISRPVLVIDRIDEKGYIV